PRNRSRSASTTPTTTAGARPRATAASRNACSAEGSKPVIRAACRTAGDSPSRPILAIIARHAPLPRVVPGPVSRDGGHPVDGGIRAAAGVFLEFHPARELPRHRRRLPAGGAAPQADRLVSAGAVRGVRRRRSAPARSGAAELLDDLLLERHGHA